MQPVLTSEQLDAVQATGNVLVVAGAGTGKTSTLVERCLAHLLDPNRAVSLEAILMVTFTEAAAAEIRQRLRSRLDRQLESDPENHWLMEQLARVETARISTLHSFCLSLIRDHFYELGLDPELVVLSQDQADLLAADKLGEILQAQLAGTSPQATAVQSLVSDYARGQDKLVHTLVLRLHHYTQTLIDPEGWLEQQIGALSRTDPEDWLRWLHDGFIEWQSLWLPELNRQPADNEKAAACARQLESLPQNTSRQEWAAALSEILALDADWPRGTKTRHRAPLARFYDEAAFLASLAGLGKDQDPLVEDWTWVREPMAALVELTRRFAAHYAATKRELAAVDFHDLEQFALRLLWDRSQSAPTSLAQHWQRELQHILVDEVQDINPAQDRILTALARAGDASNRFLVGDVKQSIYRFRLADPRIFQAYAHEWAGPAQTARVLTLTGNFRSHPAILHFVNRLFAGLLRPEVGGLAYTEDQWLQPGPTATPRSAAPDSKPVVELHWIVAGPRDGIPDTPFQDASEHTPAGFQEEPRAETEEESSTAEREARLVARRIEKLMREGRTVIDRQTGAERPLAWNDVAVLLRSPRTRTETYARVFAALGLPLQAGRGRFYDSLEISDLVSLLQILDNPYQDIPLLAVLRSPLGGFTPDDLVCIRIAQRRTSLWSALRRVLRQGETPPPRSEWNREPPCEPTPSAAPEGEPDAKAESWLASRWPPAWHKARLFLEAYRRWRRLGRITSLSECLETILEESGYEAWLSAQAAPDPPLNRIRRLLALTRTFDQFQRQGLHRFLHFVEARRDSEADTEPAGTVGEDAVRLLSVHQSKGLEFPVVVLADLGKRFNFDDLRAPIILDEVYGLCPLVRPPAGGRPYPSLPHWLAARRQRRETLGEELRLLYVACTRARDQLILCGTASRAMVEQRWPSAGTQASSHAILAAYHWLDWLGPWWFGGASDSCHPQWVAERHDSEDAWLRPLQRPPDHPLHPATVSHVDLATIHLTDLVDRLHWSYAHRPATREPAKASVSQLRLRARNSADEETRLLFIAPAPAPDEQEHGLDAAARGTAHHLIMEWLPLNSRVTQGGLLATVETLRTRGGLNPQEALSLDLPAIMSFWHSELGERIQDHHAAVQRELPFTSRFSANDLQSLGVPVAAGLAPTEYFVVQGVIDLAVLLPEQIWLVDFKTDRVSSESLADHSARYSPQLGLYALALERIYRRPVTERWLHFLHLRRSIRTESLAAG